MMITAGKIARTPPVCSATPDTTSVGPGTAPKCHVRKLSRYCRGATPTRSMKARRIAATDPKPHRWATPFRESLVSTRHRQAASRRAEITYSPGVRPVSWRNFRTKSRSLIPAILQSVPTRRSLSRFSWHQSCACWIGRDGGKLRPQLRRKLRLPAGTLEKQHENAGDAQGEVPPVILLDQRQREVDPRRNARRRVQIAVADENRIDLHHGRRMTPRQFRGLVPMRRHPFARRASRRRPARRRRCRSSRTGAPWTRCTGASRGCRAAPCCRRRCRPTPAAYRPAAAAPSSRRRE